MNELRVHMTEKEKQTIAYYNEHAKQWSNNHSADENISFWLSELAMFKHYVPQGKILEFGIGGAGEAAEIIKSGYVYTGIDPAGELIEIAQKRFPQAVFLKQSIHELNLPSSHFDGFWCSAVFLHIPPQSMDGVLQKIKQVMKPGAIGFISLAEGSEEYFDKKTGRYFYLYEEKKITEILIRNGFAIEKSAIRYQDTHRIWLRSWLTFFVRVSAF